VTPAARSRLSSLGELLAVGGLTPLLFPLSWLLRRAVAPGAAELAVGFTMFHAAHVINDPHFAVTYVLFYEDTRGRVLGSVFPPAQRLRYVVAGFVVPVVLAAWAGVALAAKSAVVMGALLQLMFALVGWHYVKQGFGAAMVLSARRGVTFLPRERVAILAHCLAGWAFAWANPAEPARELEEKGVVYTGVAHPAWFERVTGLALIATLVVMVVLLALKWRRERRLPLLTPLTAMLCSVWAWSIFSSADPLVLYVVPALHSVQYLWFVGLLRRNEAASFEGAPTFGPTVRSRLGLLAASALGLGWVLFHGAPALLDDALVKRADRFTDLGPTPWFAAIYAFVNIHHYCMDHVLWRRDNPRTRYLRGPDPAPPLEGASTL
jgi:hypothetical protein